jgi:glycosyltransferase involved in cell wall biosynthesis
MDNNNGKNTLVIIPCYNEETTIGSVVLKAKNYIKNILVINDGSTDDTAKIAKSAGAYILSHKKNYGKSAAIRNGFKYALKKKFDYVITIDGDGQHNPDEIPFLLTNIQNNGDDIVLGSRSNTNLEMPGWRRFGKNILDYITSFGNGGYLVDSQNGFRAFNKKAMKALSPNLNGKNYCSESEQIIKAHELGLDISQVNVSCKYKDLKKTSAQNPASHGLSVLRYIIWLVAESHPLLFIGLPGFILIILGLFFGIQTLQYYNQTHVFLISYAILVSILLIIGVLAMFIGLVLNVLPRIIRNAKSIEKNIEEG